MTNANDTLVHSVNTTRGLCIERGQLVSIRDTFAIHQGEVVGLSLAGAIVRRPGMKPTTVRFDRIVAVEVQAR